MADHYYDRAGNRHDVGGAKPLARLGGANRSTCDNDIDTLVTIVATILGGGFILYVFLCIWTWVS